MNITTSIANKPWKNKINFNKAIKGKKAQLTIFIIIGIVLLFSAATILYIKQSITQYKPPIESIEQVSAELQPIQNYVTECLDMIAKEAIRKAGTQGGYLDVSNILFNDADPTSGEGISMSPGSEIKIPYWYYMKSANNCEEKCVFASKQPSLYRKTGFGNSIEEQIDKYIEQKLSSCTREFTSFEAQGFDVQESSIKAITTITKTNVFVQLNYPLTIIREGVSEKISKFTVRIPINLGKFYDLAAELTQKEISTSFLGFMAINLIDVYSGTDENKLPPLVDYVFGKPSKEMWLHRDVKSKLEELLMIYTSALQATGTDNFKGNYYEGTDQFAEGLYSLFILPLNNTHQSNAEFTYLSWWPTYLKVTPSEGELIKPDSAANFDSIISSFGINVFKFSYDVSYPVLITLSDSESMDGEGFVFQFALESNIRNNRQIQSDTSLISYSGRPAQTLVCDIDNYNSNNVTVEVIDSLTKKPVEGAAVYFSFGNEACFIGETKLSDFDLSNNKITGAAINDINKKAILKSKMPVGIGALVISKDGYITKTVLFATSLTEKKKILIELDRFIDIDVSLARIPVFKKCNINAAKNCNWQLSPPAISGIEPTQSAIISLIRIPENNAQEQFIATTEFSGIGNRTKKIRLVPGNYQVLGSLFDNQKVIIPEDEVCYPDDWYDSWGLGKKKCEIIPLIEFNMFPKGGIMINSFKIDAQSLGNNKELVVNLISTPDGYLRNVGGITNLEHKDLEQSGNIERYSRDYFEIIKPIFK